MTVYTTSGLGWTENTNCDSDLSTFLSGTYVSGDTLSVDGTYRLATDVNLPAGLTIRGAADGNGFDIMSGADPVILRTNGNDIIFDNLTFDVPDAPVWSSFQEKNNPVVTTDYQNTNYIRIMDHSGCVVRNCDFQGQLSQAIYLDNANGPVIEHNRFQRSTFAIAMHQNTRNGVVKNNYFNNIISEAIKTISFASTSVAGVNNMACINNQFYRINRSGYDTTGGWQNCTHTNDQIAQADEPYDFKVNWDNEGEEALDKLNRNITINGAHIFSNAARVLVTTHIQDDSPTWMTAVEWSTYGPRDITFNDVEVEVQTTQNTNQVVLDKGSVNVVWNDLVVRDFDPEPSLIRTLSLENVGNGGPGDAPAGWDHDTPSDGGLGGSMVFNNTTYAGASGVDPATDWGWTKKPNSTTLRLTSGGSLLFLGSSPLILS